MQARLGVVATALAAIAGVLFALSGEGDNIGILPPMVVAGSGLVCARILRTTGQAHAAALMPIIAETFGLTYAKDARAFLDTAPQPFIPLGLWPSADHLLFGQLAGQPFIWAKVKTKTGGNRSRILFDGLVLKIGFAGMPPVLAAPFAKTRPGLMSVADIPTYGPQQVAHLGEGWPSGLGLWTKPAPDGLSPDIATEVLRRIARVADPMGNVLHSAVTTDSGLWLSITHNGRLFAVGGILATEAQLMADLRRAAADIAALVAATGAGLALAVWLADQVTPAAPETALDVRTSALPKPGPAR